MEIENEGHFAGVVFAAGEAGVRIAVRADGHRLFGLAGGEGHRAGGGSRHLGGAADRLVGHRDGLVLRGRAVQRQLDRDLRADAFGIGHGRLPDQDPHRVVDPGGAGGQRRTVKAHVSGLQRLHEILKGGLLLRRQTVIVLQGLPELRVDFDHLPQIADGDYGAVNGDRLVVGKAVQNRLCLFQGIVLPCNGQLGGSGLQISVQKSERVHTRVEQLRLLPAAGHLRQPVQGEFLLGVALLRFFRCKHGCAGKIQAQDQHQQHRDNPHWETVTVCFHFRAPFFASAARFTTITFRLSSPCLQTAFSRTVFIIPAPV